MIENINKSSMLYWFPKLENLGIPIPKTKFIKLNKNEKKEYTHGEGDWFNLNRLEKEINKVIQLNFNLPVFIRTDEYSGKHSWKKTCYLDDIGNLKNNLQELVCESRMINFVGLPIEAIAVREFIPMDTKFTAFYGEMPVNPERRYFIRDGKVECHHPYWIENSIRKPSTKNWRKIAKNMNKEGVGEIKLLIGYSQKVAKVIRGYWSVDFCKSKKEDWYLIDMAEGKESWHPSDCKYSDMPEEKPVKKPNFSLLIKKRD